MSRRKRLITLFSQIWHLFSDCRGHAGRLVRCFSICRSRFVNSRAGIPCGVFADALFRRDDFEASATADTRTADPSECISRTDGTESGEHKRTIALQHTTQRTHTCTLAGKVNIYVSLPSRSPDTESRSLDQFAPPQANRGVHLDRNVFGSVGQRELREVSKDEWPFWRINVNNVMFLSTYLKSCSPSAVCTLVVCWT